MIIVMNVFFNNASENLVHDYFDLTTDSSLPQEIAQVSSYLKPESLTARALSTAADSWSDVIAQSTNASADQLYLVAAMLTRMRREDTEMSAQLRRLMRLDSAGMFSAAAMLRQHASSLATLRAASNDYQRAIAQAGFSGNALDKALDNTREASKSLGAPAQRMDAAARLLEAFATLQQRAEKLMLG